MSLNGQFYEFKLNTYSDNTDIPESFAVYFMKKYQLEVKLCAL